MTITIRTRRGTASDWASENPTLALGELGGETDTGNLKFGDGTTAWNDLPYIAAGDTTDPVTASAEPVQVIVSVDLTDYITDPAPYADGDLVAIVNQPNPALNGIYEGQTPDPEDMETWQPAIRLRDLPVLVTAPYLQPTLVGIDAGEFLYGEIDGEWVPFATTESVAAVAADVTTLGNTVENLTAADIETDTSGVLALANSVAEALNAIEGHIDGARHVRGYFTAAVPALSTLQAGPVADLDQPVTDDGQQVVKGDFVATLGDVDSNGDYWIHHVHPTTGQWGAFPTTGTVVPSGADTWDNAIATNHLKGGDVIVSKSGTLGVFLGERVSGSFTGSRGGPDILFDDFNGGEWVFIGGGTVTSVAGRTGAVTLTKSDVGLGNVTDDAQIPKSLVDAKGDLLVGTADNTPARLAVGSSGTVPVSNSNETTGIGWAPMASTVIFESGSQVCLAPYVSTNTALTSGRIVYYRFRVPKRITFDRFGINHVSGVSSTGSIYLGIYSPTGVAGMPGSRLIDITSGGAIDPTTTAGLKFITGSWTLDPGDYWYGILPVFTGTAPTVAHATVAGAYIVPDSTGAGNQTPFQNGLSALPSPATGYSVGVNSAPVMLARPA